MESIFTKFKWRELSLVFTVLLVLHSFMSYGQSTKTLANEVTYSSPNVPANLAESLGPSSGYSLVTVENPDNAIVDDENFARLLASPGVLLGLGSYNGEIELKFPSTLDANTTVYVRAEGSDDLFGLLLGGNLGELLGDVLSLVALGEQAFTIVARDGTNDVFSRSTTEGFNISRARIITGPDGNYYIALTPDADFDRIYIENGSLSLLGLGDQVNLDIYNAFSYDGAAICGNPIGTSYDVSGVNLDLLNLTGSVADDLHFSIDGDPSTYTSLSPGVLSLAGVLEQHFYFDGLGQASDEVKVTLSGAPGILDVDLLDNVELVAYNGDTEVSRQNLETLGGELLGIAQLDLLGLLADGNPVTFTMAPGAAIDRFEIEVSTLLNLGTSESLRVHEVMRVPGRPIIDGVDSEQNMLVCAGEDVTLNATVASGDVVKWYDAPVGGTLQHTGASFNLGEIGSKVSYYAAAERPGCPEESIRVPVTVDINPNPLIALNGSAVYNVAIGESVVLPPASATNEDGTSVPVTWSGLDGAPFSAPNTAGVFATGGKYVYRVSASGTDCTNFVDVVVNVFDPDGCPLVFNRRYATSAEDFTTSNLLGLQLGTVSNPTLAAGSSLDDYSLVSETVGTSLLGLTGETSQTIRWNTMIPAGTPVTIKLGREYGAAGVSGGIYVQALDGDPVGGDNLIGVRQVADANLVSAVNGINEFEYTFIPTDINGIPVPYNGVKVSLASLLNAVQNVRVYGAYYHETSATLASCTFGVLHIMTGFESIIGGLDVATGLTAVTNPEAAADGDEDTFAAMNNLVGANVSSKLDITFTAPAIAGDSVYIKVGSATGLLDLTLLEGYQIQRYFGNQAVGDPLDAEADILTLNLLEGGTEQALTFINDVPFDRIKILSGGVADALNELRVYEVELLPLRTISGEQHDDIADVDYIEICPGDIIDVPSATCDAVKFYTDETGGTEITVADIAGWAPNTVQTVYLQIVRFGCEDGIERRPIEIRVLGTSDELLDEILINGTNVDTFCPVDPVTLEAVLISGAPAGVTYQWYSDNAGTPEIITGETGANISLAGLTAGNYTYYVQLIADGFCTAEPTPVSFTINRNADDGDINLDDLITQCVGAPVVLGPTSSIANPVFSWYYDAAKTNPITDGDVNGAITYNIGADGGLTITGLADGADMFYYVTVSGDNVCENITGKEVNVQVSNSLPAPTFTDAGLKLCGPGNDAVFEVTNFSGGLSYTLYDAEVGGSIVSGVTVVDNIITISNVTVDETYWVEVNGSGGCVGVDRAMVTVTINRIADADDIDASGGTICEGDGFTLSASSSTVTNPVFTWYIDAALTTVLSNTTVTPSTTTTYYVTVSGDGVCENEPGNAETVTVTVNRNATDIDIDATGGTICEGDSYTLSATSSTVTNPVFTWYSDATLTTVLSSATVSPSTTTSYYVTVSGDGVCENQPGDAKEIVVTVNRNAFADDILPVGGTICNGDSFTLTATSTTVTNPIFTWYSDLALTTEVLDPNVNPTATTTYYVTVQGDGVCENKPGDAATLTVVVNRNATALDINVNDATICEGDSYSLSATSSTVTNPIFTWYTDAALTTLLADNEVSPTMTTTYYVTVQGDGVCENKPGDADMVTVTVNRNATAADIDATGGTICEGDSFTLSATSSTVTDPVFTWYTDAALTTVVSNLNVSPTTTTTYYVTVQGDGVCENKAGNADMVTVTVNRNATAADIDATSGTICEGDSFALSAASSTVTDPVFTWYTDASLTTVLADVNVSPTTTTTYYVTVQGDGVCENKAGDAKEVIVTVNRNATAADIDATGGTICEGDSFTLSATSSTVTNPVFTWYTDAALTTVLTGPDASPTTTTTYYVTVQGDGVCENKAGDAKEVIVTVNRNATAADIDATGGTICEGDSFTLSATSSTVTDPVFTWYTDAALTTVVSNPNVSPTTTTTYYVTVQGDGVCENKAGNADMVTVTVNRNATAADIDATSGTICEGDSFALSAASSTVTDPVFTWYTDASLTTVLADVNVSPTTTTTYYVTVQGDGVCENKAGDAKEVIVTVNRNATAADIDATGGTICEGDSFTLSATSSTVTNPVFTWYTDAALTTVLSNATVSPIATTTYYVTVSGDGVCENKAGDADMVTVTVNRNATAGDIDATGGTICEGDSFTLSATSSTVTDPVFTWYTDAALTTVVSNPNVSPTTTTTYYVTVQGDGVCENKAGNTDMVTVTVNRNATAADIDATSGTICEGDSFTLSAASSTVSDPVFTWYTDAALTTVLSSTTVSPTATTTYYVTVSGDGVCENKPGDAEMVTVTVNRTATAADIDTNDATICEGDSYTLTATSSTITSPVFTWYTDAALTTVLSSTTVSPTATTTYYLTISGDGVCENKAGDAEMVTVTVNRNASAADIDTNNATICEGDSYNLSATSSTVSDPVFTWYADAALTTVLSSATVSPSTTTTYYVTVSGDGVCENKAGDADMVTVTVNRNATAADIESTGGTICEGDSFTLSASSSTVTSPVFTWYTDAALTTVLSNATVSPTVTTTYYVTVSGDGVCENKAGDAEMVTVTVNSLPAPTTNLTEQSFCSAIGGTIGDLQVNESAIVWYDAPVGGNSLSEALALTQGMTYYAALTNPGTGCESIQRLAITVSNCANLEVVKTMDVTSVIVGEMFDYTIAITNNGASTAQNVTVTDEVPVELQVLAASSDGIISGNTVTWSISEIASGETVQLTLSVMAMTESAGVVNSVEVASDNSTPDDDETDPLPILSDDVDMSIEKTVSSSAIEVGGEFVYALKITNKGDIPARNVTVTDFLPQQVRYIQSNAGGEIQEAYDGATRQVTFIIPEMEGGEEIVIQLTVEAIDGGLVTNSANVSTPDQDEILDLDNTATVSHNQFEITIPNVFTPNGDGMNDTWQIEGLAELYPENDLIVVNRWGGEVYKVSNYNNDWDGGSLNEGTYYYKLKIRDRESGREVQFTGYVTILR
ncbi:gliding motility-associated C-terminal domain-containing protein [Echinicola sp. CAU 1574]|uniref:Gliding motility-associated C-terminal domain-containing protein n=1 Tax=Echinicola arenosa TaxID=2774144 RepID=A0ABR9AG11_9BACT|nr:gliding motility-associated C-terminal domain-containing protein [Echinicola arenosa]MBD8487797.1 gliding motility-associated C-terminal domain-containing protein [Echinicola arenosa]